MDDQGKPQREAEEKEGENEPGDDDDDDEKSRERELRELSDLESMDELEDGGYRLRLILDELEKTWSCANNTSIIKGMNHKPTRMRT